jgi:circadian clock protein KaiB
MDSISGSEKPGDDTVYRFRLFVAGDGAHSRTAKSNLEKLFTVYSNITCDIEIVDVLMSHEIALENHIFLTPALQMVFPEPSVTIFGDLSNEMALVKALRLEGKE